MADDKQKQEGDSSRIKIIVTVIPAVGVLGAAIIASWHNIFPSSSKGSLTNSDKILPASSTDIPLGNYKGSCSDISVKGDILTANCRKANSEDWQESRLDFKPCKFGIENNDGKLECKKL
ncbi:MAG: hypothetical protein Fur006_23990 [Coleofasciculaceae cyanobacterium]